MARLKLAAFLLFGSICVAVFADGPPPSADGPEYPSVANNTNATGQKDTVGKAYGGGYQHHPAVPPPLPPYGGYGGNYGNSYSGGNAYGGPSNYNGYAPPPPTYDTYGGGYNVQDQYNQQPYYPQQQQQQYGQSHYPIYGPSYHKNYQHDSYYCSVHGSFALAYTQKGYGGYEKSGDSSYGSKSGYGGDSYGKQENSYSYGNEGGYSDNGKGYPPQQSYYKPRVYSRQYCRYAASASERACHFCCRVVARSSNTSPDDIFSAIFAFDPLNPGAYSAGYDNYGSEKSYDQKADYGKSKQIFQCVCCAPKDNSYGGY